MSKVLEKRRSGQDGPLVDEAALGLQREADIVVSNADPMPLIEAMLAGGALNSRRSRLA